MITNASIQAHIPPGRVAAATENPKTAYAQKCASNLLESFKQLSNDVSQADTFQATPGASKAAAVALNHDPQPGRVNLQGANLAAAIGKSLNPALAAKKDAPAAGLALDHLTGFAHLAGHEATSLDLTDGNCRYVLRQEHDGFGFGPGVKSLYTVLTKDGEKDNQVQWAPAAQLIVNPDGTLDFACSKQGEALFAQPIPMFVPASS